MNKPHIEWQRDNVTKYSNINRMKNGLRKSYFYENNCKHDKTVEEVECLLCGSFFDCCDICYMDFSKSDVTPKTYDDLACPDCLEKCIKCNKFIVDDDGSRSDVYPYDLYCEECAESIGDTYDDPNELNKDDNSDDDDDDDDNSDDNSDDDEAEEDEEDEDN